MTRRIAFYAPMKPPGHPTPSGDRQIARLMIGALARTGAEVAVASELRTLDMAGDSAVQARLTAEAADEAARLIGAWRARPPALWFTYHCYYKAPDLLGPAVSAALGLAYVIAEPSVSPRRRTGPWAPFAAASEAAIARADRLLWTTARDRPGLEAAGCAARLTHLPAWIVPGPAPTPRPAARPLRLITVAMMRAGDKHESYRRLANALARLPGDWTLEIIGDGPERAAVAALFAPFAGRVHLAGRIDAPERIRDRLAASDLFVWPGVGEGVGLVYLEAQDAGLPVVAEAHPAPRALIGCGATVPPDDPAAFAAAIRRAADSLPGARAEAHAHVARHHSADTAARILADVIGRAGAGT